MSASAPRIGFDRFLALDWVSAAMRVRAGIGSREQLIEQLNEAGLAVTSRQKSVTLLNRLWIEPRPDVRDFCDRGLDAWKAGSGVHPVAYAWGVAIVTYPFFAKVAEQVGRLISIQGDCQPGEVHRRMQEVYGQRDAIRRATNAVLQTYAQWGVIERQDRGRRLSRLDPIPLSDDGAIAWLIEAALRCSGRSIPASSVGSLAVLYPFLLNRPLAMVIAQADQLELRYQGPGEQLLGLRC
jgi:hypothetical protein